MVLMQAASMVCDAVLLQLLQLQVGEADATSKLFFVEAPSNRHSQMIQHCCIHLLDGLSPLSTACQAAVLYTQALLSALLSRFLTTLVKFSANDIR